MICHFPVINEEFLEVFLWEDELLINMVAEQFYLKVLEQLLQFCANHNAAKLVLHVSCPKASALEFYKPFVAHTEALTYNAREVALTIRPDRVLYEKLMIYMDTLSREFQQTLQEEQGDDPMVQQYLKLSSFANQAVGRFLTY